MSARSWWQDGLLLLGGALFCLGVGWIIGGALEGRRGEQRNRHLVAASDSSLLVREAVITRLGVLAANRETLRREAQARAEAAERRAQSASRDVLAARDSLVDARSAADSLLAYPPLVDALTRQVTALDSARLGYRDALTASQQRAALMALRITADSAEIVRQRNLLATVTPPPPSKSGWGCTAGVTIAGGLRSGAGIGITCGRRLG